MSCAAHPVIVIATGGEGRRMGGAKPMRELAGRSLLDHALAWAAQHSDMLALAVRDEAQLPLGSLPSGVPLLPDERPGLGPVSALLSAMRLARANNREAVMLIGCDQPFLPADLPARLLEAIGPQAVAMPVSAGKDQPLASLWRLRESALEHFIAEGGRSLWRLADSLGAVRVTWEGTGGPQDPFANINDPESLALIGAVNERGRASLRTGENGT
jgi:molybdenum cofactor guanylyltransferase